MLHPQPVRGVALSTAQRSQPRLQRLDLLAQRSRSRDVGSKRLDLLVPGALPRAGPLVQRPKATRRATLPHQLPALCLKLLLQRHAPREQPDSFAGASTAAAATPPPAVTPCSHPVAIHPVHRNPESVSSDAAVSRCLYISGLHATNERLHGEHLLRRRARPPFATHPHNTRGEHASASARTDTAVDSSPHVRGTHQPARPGMDRQRLISAYAENIFVSTLCC